MTAPVLGPVLAATAAACAARHLAVELALETGYALVGARGRAGDEGHVGIDGLWFGVSLALGYGT
jgi:hypothetical protein